MSRSNKVNPGMYTQRGRLTQDDAARELRRQREFGAPHAFEKGRQGKLFHFKGSEPVDRPEPEPEPEKPKPVKAKAKAARKTAKKTPAKTAKKAAKKAAKKPAAKKVARKAAKTATRTVAAKARRRS